jgi:hypothetical protein
MFRASSCPSSGATTTAVAASGLPSELGDSTAVGRGRAGRPILNQKTFEKNYLVKIFLWVEKVKFASSETRQAHLSITLH